MSQSNSPIFIIVGAIMSILAIGIGLNITTNVALDGSEHDDRDEVNKLAQSIEQECDRIQELEGTYNFDERPRLDLRQAGVKLEEKSLEYDPNGNTDTDLIRDLDCTIEIENKINFVDSPPGFIPIGENTIIIEESSGAVEVSNQ